MIKLAVKLPPFAPDYSGVCSALFELGGLVVIHDASGCTGNYTGYDEPRWYDSGAYIYCSALREIDAVMGNDHILADRIQKAAEELRPRFIAVLGSPVPMVIGSDFRGMAAEIEKKTGLPTFGFATTGLNYYDKGVSEALVAYARRFVNEKRERKKHAVNLLGATPLDFGHGNNIDGFKQELAARGLEVLAVFALGSEPEELAESSAAAVNVVISASGYQLAEYFQKAFGTPYVIGQPLGERQTDRLCELIERTEGADRKETAAGQNHLPVPVNSDAHILLLGEQVTMHSLRACLSEDFGYPGAAIGCPFAMLPKLTHHDDLLLTSEKAISSMINCHKYTHLLGDPFFNMLNESGLKFIPLAHVAVSSKVYWDEAPELAGKRTIELLKGVF